MRDAKGRFTKGADPTRHIFTRAECIAGYEALVSKICLNHSCGSYWGKRWAFVYLCHKEARIYNNPALIPELPLKFGVNASDEDPKKWLKLGTNDTTNSNENSTAKHTTKPVRSTDAEPARDGSDDKLLE